LVAQQNGRGSVKEEIIEINLESGTQVLPDRFRVESDGTTTFLVSPDGSFIEYRKNGDIVLQDGTLVTAQEQTPEAIQKKAQSTLNLIKKTKTNKQLTLEKRVYDQKVKAKKEQKMKRK
jgi:hypothetical protein